MTIYLYVKTHRKTGLKYLGKTKQNPYVYFGSGKDWLDHINLYGKDIETEILKECSSTEELSKWGRHYSELWDVVRSEQWANRIPETGGGPGSTSEQAKIRSSGKSNSRYNPTIYSFAHESGKLLNVTMYDFKRLHPEVPSNKVSLLVAGDRKSVLGWRLISTSIDETGRNLTKKKLTDSRTYSFIHENGQTLSCSRYEFGKISGISRSCVNEIVLRNKTRKGWKLDIK